ncbi:MAG TPA: LicD family protein [Marmoricola sp.]
MARGWRIDDAGLHTPAPVDGALDVFFGDERIWSFSCAGDGARANGGVDVPWPPRLVPLLDGATTVRVVGHNDGVEHHSEAVSFGSGEGALLLRDEHGNPLSVDKTGRLQRSFSQMGDDSRLELIRAARELTDALQAKGIDVYLAYGCLLGAVRNGKMIGHDSDIDLAFLSKYDHPFDIIRESRWIEAQTRSLGWQVVRLSAANFKVWVPLPNGKRAGVDVFGSFYVGDHFHITGNLRGALPRSALLPFGTVTLEGVEFPAPADLDGFLAFTYGPSWRVPDPSFHFNHPAETKVRMNAWLRTSRHGTRRWEEAYSPRAHSKVPKVESDFAHWVAGRIDAEDLVVDIGSGSGRDALWLRDQGFEVLATDFSAAARRLAAATAQAEGRRLSVRPLNLNSPYSVLLRGARLAQRPGVKHMYVHDVVGVLAPSVRPYLWRLCSMTGRTGGRAFLAYADRDDLAGVRDEIVAAGGRLLTDRVAKGPAGKTDRRWMEVSWTR